MSKSFLFAVLAVIFNNVCGKNLKCCRENEVLSFLPNKTTDRYECVFENDTDVIPLLANQEKTLNDLMLNCSSSFECIDKTTCGQVIKLNCDRRRKFVKFNINEVYKCCPKGMFYNITGKMCGRLKTSNKIPIIVDEMTNFETNYNFCDGNGVVIDILTNITKIQLNQDRLQLYNRLTGLYESITVKESCFDTNEEGFMVVRSCQNIDKCNGMSCVRKCCGFGASYVLENNKAICKQNQTFVGAPYYSHFFLAPSDRRKNMDYNGN